MGGWTYSIVRGLLVLVSLLVGLGLGLIGSLLLVGQGLPLLAESLANVACCESGALAVVGMEQ